METYDEATNQWTIYKSGNGNLGDPPPRALAAPSLVTIRGGIDSAKQTTYA